MNQLPDPLPRYNLYVPTGRGNFDPLHLDSFVTDDLVLHPLQHIRCNGVTHGKGVEGKNDIF